MVFRRKNPSRYRRRRNPKAANLKAALSALGLAALGGALGYGVDWGVSHVTIAAPWQTALGAGIGILGTLGLAKWGDERLAAGLGGVTAAVTIARVRDLVGLRTVTPPTQVPAAQGQAAAMRGHASAVYQSAAAVYQAQAAALRKNTVRTMRAPVYGSGFKRGYREAGASFYTPGPVRYFGPRSWAYNTESGVVVRYRSAHQTPSR